MTNQHEKRKQHPIYTGVLQYFPDAINAVAHCSFIGNEQHNPGTKLHWDRSKSGDEHDAMLRHAMEAGTTDTDGILHSTKTAWRALAALQKEIEENGDSDFYRNNPSRTYIVTYGLGDDLEGANFDYNVYDSKQEALDCYDMMVGNGCITADVSKCIKSTEC
jgi:hypothetical protein